MHGQLLQMLCLGLQVGLAINCMSTCGLIHAAVMKTGKMYVAEGEEAEFMRACRRFALRCAAACLCLCPPHGLLSHA